MSQFKAFLFDLNGTMINDMDYHIRAWYEIVNRLGANISLQTMKEQCYGKNNELLERIFPGRFTEKQKDEMSLEKEKKYQNDFRPQLKLIKGLDKFLSLAYQSNIKLAIGSAAIMLNMDFVLDGLNIRKYFSALVSADEVAKSKPNPETYLKCADALKIAPADCLVFEDALKGVESAINAEMKSVVITLMSEQEEFRCCPNVLYFIDDFTDKRLKELFS